MIIHRCGDVEIYHPVEKNEHYAIVETPAQEFMLEIFTLKKGECFTIPSIPVPRIFIGYKGIGKTSKNIDMK